MASIRKYERSKFSPRGFGDRSLMPLVPTSKENQRLSCCHQERTVQTRNDTQKSTPPHTVTTRECQEGNALISFEPGSGTVQGSTGGLGYDARWSKERVQGVGVR